MNMAPATVYVLKDGRQIGPYSERELRTHWANGVVAENDMVWRQGMPDYVPLGDFFNIRVISRPTPVLPESAESVEMRSEVEDLFARQSVFIQESPQELQNTSRVLQGDRKSTRLNSSH